MGCARPIIVATLCAVGALLTSLFFSLRLLNYLNLPDVTSSPSPLPVVHSTPPRSFPPVIWMAPFYSGGGYCSEAISFVTSLSPSIDLQVFQHGDSWNFLFLKGLPHQTQVLLFSLSNNHIDPRKAIVICHSEPGAWNPPKWDTELCPPPLGAGYTIGRTVRCCCILSFTGC